MKYISMAIMLAFSSLLQAGLRPADGMWGTDDDPENGSGLMMTTQSGITVVSVFTYDQDGNNAWYLGSGQVDEAGSLEVELRQTQSGDNITNENPQAASFVEPTRNLLVDFDGTQIGSMSIDGSDEKTIRAQHFGIETTFQFPDFTGQWVVGNSTSEQSVILDIVDDGYSGVGAPPVVFINNYSSTHPSSVDWDIDCVVGFSSEQACFFLPGDSSDIPELQILDLDIGNQRMELKSLDGTTTYHAFRLDEERSLIPNDGHWRPSDDPAVGSGLVMRTQGEYTIALLYTYDDNGKAIWQIASGMFDENGYMVADLNLPDGGTAIENPVPATATFSEQVQTLEIQLQGTDLATFSIDGSADKAIQNSNFGAQLFQTEHVLLDDEPFKFPNQVGSWAVADYTVESIRPAALQINELSGTISPIPPTKPRLYFGLNFSEDDTQSFDFNFACLRIVIDGEVMPSCDGDLNESDTVTDSRVYFEDIGHNRFRFYVGTPSDDGRELPYLDFFRIPAD